GRAQAQRLVRAAAARARLERADAMLASLSPRAVLERGYAIALAADGRAITDAAAVGADDDLRLVLARGELAARVIRDP
ncbi:MAG: exodeoxyribonuclease VII large subunit, partial [Solimonas sp.]